MPHYVYVLRCRDGSLYTGYTTDVGRRLEQHRQGLGARYTRSRLPVVLAYAETHPGRADALTREREIKSWARRAKEALVMPRGR